MTRPINPMTYCDFYKVGHFCQYPKGTNKIYVNITPRGSRIPGVDKVVVFGIQYFIKEYLQKKFKEDFFDRPKEEVMNDYKRRIENALGPNCITFDHIAALHDLGYIPIHIKALPEGSLCNLRSPLLTIVNTKDEFYWLPNFLETIICNVTWGGITSATTAHIYRKILDKYAAETSDIPEFVQWQGHDFSMRGMFGFEASLISGGGHLLSFTGTDTIPAIDFLEIYYGADSDKELIGGSVAATEHSVMCMGGEESEKDTYLRLIKDVYPTGIVSIVSDTWDYWNIIDNVLPSIKDVIMNRDGKLVIRPDSGDPVDIICKSVPKLWDIFGGTITLKGYKQLDPHIGMIYGDSITVDRCVRICQGLKDLGFTSTNVVYGIGSYTYQHVTRDTFGLAMKATWGKINDVPYNIFKAPKTDSGLKNSAKGLLKVNEDGSLSECVTEEEEKQGLLQDVYIDGVEYNTTTLSEIRERLARN